MKIIEPQKEIPVIAETDVLVVGGGPAGLTAAIASGRLGAKTMLVERYGCLGGMLTQAGVESFAWYRHEGTVDCEGIGREYEVRAQEVGFARQEPQSKSLAIDTEGFKVIADRMIAEANVTPLYHSWVVEVLKEGNTIYGVIVESKSGRGAILAKRIVDCTGDADVAALAGAPFNQRSTDKLMGVTVMFHCAGIGVERFNKFVAEELKPTYADWGKNWTIQTTGKEDDMFSPYMEEIFTKAQEEGVIPGDASAIAGTWSTFSEAGEAHQLNMVYSFGYDCTNAWDLTKAEIEGRQQALWAIDALKHYVPGFEKAKLRNFGMTLGTRESRLIVGETHIDDEHVLNQGRCNDSIGIFPEFIDGSGYLILPTTGRYFQIPYGCLVPQQVENLLVAGRSISGGVVAHTSMRNMMCCAVTGEGAGTAAAESLKQGVNARDVDMTLLQNTLVKQGVRIH
ncbi:MULTISPECIES: FAD-dependent oxidoreductase [Vibrio harveyi group]|uniref:FAD-dependent oxidoreductase n=1 Tax=Vibrio harveyi group TaxID=717610 RepID=UPI0003A14669|nr:MULTISPECIES: FAD-dependent oxidoreductase [Vibrio harveyi group]KIP66600.1 pyridine nucleotide-disulfide oxidoreductase [Vibrio harveyi]PAW12201.1 FAD-dependent oxidoreductase [Vibrio sp. V1B]